MRTAIYCAKLIWNIHRSINSADQIFTRQKRRTANRTRNQKSFFLCIFTADFSSFNFSIFIFQRFKFYIKVQQKNYKRKSSGGNKICQHRAIINSKKFYFNKKQRIYNKRLFLIKPHDIIGTRIKI